MLVALYPCAIGNMAALQVKKAKKKSSKSGKKKKNTDSEGDILRLEDVLDLGGSKEDFEMLMGQKENVVENTKNETIKIDEPLSGNEIQEMVKSLGLDQMAMDDVTNESDVSEDLASSKKGDDPQVPKTPPFPDDKRKEEESFKIEKITYIPKFEKQKKLQVQPYELWYDQLPNVAAIKTEEQLKDAAYTKVYELAKRFCEDEVALYQETKGLEKSSDAKWLRTVLSSGTLSDRVAAITMLLQDSPVHQMRCLESLISMAKKKGRREAIMAIDSLRNLWTTNLLPDRKLRYFWQWPISRLREFGKDIGKHGEVRLLILWYYEDLLKQKCEEFVECLQNLSRDTIPGIRDKTVGILYELLAMKPEQEQKLLTAIINKLGDPTRKVASRVCYLLGQLVVKHPNMKLIVIQEVERLLYRTNLSSKAQYYAICFLNQIMLTKSESAVASKLISIYFSFFKARASSSDESDSKMLSALLSGVNRAFPFVEDKEDRYDDQIDTLFKLCHTSNFQTSLQALMLIFQVMQSRRSLTDRYYRVLYEKLFDIGINTSAKRTMFLNTIYKSIKADSSLNRVKAFFKRLLQSGSTEEPNFVCGLLFLLSEVLKLKSGVKSLTMQPEEDDEDEHFEDASDDAFKAPNEDLVEQNQSGNEKIDENSDQKSGWTFRADLKRNHYDIQCRNPLYSGAQFSCAWELSPLIKHYHPSVNRFAQFVLDGNPIEYKGDPLQDFTLARFLDRFMYKNPKKNPKEHGNSIMQPRKTSERLKELPVNSKEFMDKKITKVREDEIFFYQYFKKKTEIEDSKKGKKKKRKLDAELDIEDENEGEGVDLDFAGEMQKTKDAQPKSKKRKARGEDDDDDDDDDDDENEDDYGNNAGDDVSDEGDFDYDNMQFSEDEDFDEDDFENETKQGKKKKFSDADYEKALLENLSDSDINEDPDEATSTRDSNIGSMFAAAEEFAHLLEDTGTSKGQQKQAKWETRNVDWKKTKAAKGKGVQGHKNRQETKNKPGGFQRGKKDAGHSSKQKGGGRQKFNRNRRK
ncbi:CCAAT/enhancer-binding protein zeta-like [Rhopilema esculentum]|uniref:CCAAT/enhancer-binding protein zeta-like n=1 Tax=Rhopilema esculentum TaxID=499914 RepID=UPI0031CEFD90